ncbi:hypothetical protein [Thermomonospora cellulosilytica]|uniref:Uncharacterized protein n=1 Tax=Thermomonospora cellulosilytica TaxID=1411118 RepID=A0A7W3N493_9ACTN|nr:hypothetical protein [Thermomonospora cellulosilytica]MBA9007266.1 hypothetical protein [Thermomonospora cellulosilytica]
MNEQQRERAEELSVKVRTSTPGIGLSVLLVAALGMVGCSSGNEPAPPAASKAPAARPASPTPDQDLVTWIDRVCAATRLFNEKPEAPKLEAPDGSLSDQVIRDSAALTFLEMQAYLSDIPDITRASIDLLEGLGPEPVKGGDATVAGYRSALRRLLPEVEKYRPTRNDNGLPEKTRKVAKLVDELKTDGPDLADLVAREPALAQARAKAVNCGPDGMFPQPGEGVPTPR